MRAASIGLTATASVALLVGCAASPQPETATSPAPTTTPSAGPATSRPSVPVPTDGDVAGQGPPSPRVGGQAEYRPDRPATVDLPAGAPHAVVVLVPGGGWVTADPSGLAPLAASLVADGLGVVTITYGTSSTGDHYPGPVDDVACAVAFAAQEVPDVPVVLVGHSAGAHLAALVALAPDRGAGFAGHCAHPPHPADAVVGLAGPYDVTQTRGIAAQLFGVSPDDGRDVWREGNPLTWVEARSDVPFLLVHGTEDPVVPTSFSTDFAEVLVAGGHDVRVEELVGVDHSEVVRPEVVGGLVASWVADVVPRAAP